MIYFRYRRAIVIGITMLSLLGLSACSSSPKIKEPEAPRAPIKSVALIPAGAAKLKFEYSMSLLVPFPVRMVMNKSHEGRGVANAEQVMEKLRAENFDISKRLTEQVAKQLQDAGIVVEVLNNIERKSDSPDNIDYTKIQHHSDAIMHVYFDDLSYHSPRGQEAYWPRVEAILQAYDKTGNKDLFEINTHLERGEKETRPGRFDAKDELSFTDQNDLVNDIPKVRAAFEKISAQTGQYLGKRAAELSR